MQDRPLAQQCAALSDPDGRKAARGDAQRERSFALVTVPDRQCAAGWDFCDQALGQEGADHSVGGAALDKTHRTEAPGD